MYTCNHLIACKLLPGFLKAVGLGHGSNETSRDGSIHPGALDAPLWRQRRTTAFLFRSCGFRTWERLSRVGMQARVRNSSAFCFWLVPEQLFCSDFKKKEEIITKPSKGAEKQKSRNNLYYYYCCDLQMLRWQMWYPSFAALAVGVDGTWNGQKPQGRVIIP